MKIKLTEEQYNLIKENIDIPLDEANYPGNFNMEEFKKIKSFKGRVDYVGEKLKKLGAGSSRIVYKIDDQTVLKLAKNNKGVAQNNLEIQYSNYSDIDHIVAEVFEYDDDGLWVEMELALPISEKTFERIAEVSWSDFVNTMRFYYYDSIKNDSRAFDKPENYYDVWENEFAYDMLNFLGTYQPPIGDLLRLSTYGVVKRNGQDAIVMIDYGLDEDVYKTYYNKR